MISANENKGGSAFHLLALTQGKWGERIAANINQNPPSHWVVHTWKASRVLPPVIDYPEDFLPQSFPQASLILALGDTPGLAQLIPDVVQMCGAKAVIAPIDHNASLPPGLTQQLVQWLEPLGIEIIFPKPFCSLTESTYNQDPIKKSYDNDVIREFARAFGKPTFSLEVDGGNISQVEVVRDSACGCARDVMEKLPGTHMDEAIERAGMLHHHFPCLAEMNQDSDYHDTLMHVSGHILLDAIKDQIDESLTATAYLRPHGRIEELEIEKQGRM